jgi:hypothetical protein
MAKRTQIVCQYLENISSGALEEYQAIIREYVHGRHGIYALYRRGKLYYVGLTKNLRGRLKSHLKDRHRGKWDRFSVYLTVDSGAIKELETLLLRIVQCDGNSTGGRFVRSENLAKGFSRDIQNFNRKHLDEVFGRIRRLQPKKGRIKESSGTPAPLAKYLPKMYRRALKTKYRGKRYTAYVRTDGQVRFNSKVYKTPSAAAKAVRKQATNGWQFWYFQRSPGEWVRLAKLKG